MLNVWKQNREIITINLQYILMAILIRTNHPNIVIEEIKRRIDSHQISSWSYDDDGDFLFLKDGIIAWMRPRILSNRLDFYVIGRNDFVMSIDEYAIVHSKFIELLLSYFPYECKSMLVTSPLVNENDTKNIQLLWQQH